MGITKNLIKIIGSLVALGSMFAVSLGAKLLFAPSTGEFIYHCPFTVDVMVDMEGKDTTAMDLKLLLDPSRFVVMNFDGQGGLFRTYTKPKYVTVKRGDYAGVDMVYVFLSTFTPPVGVEGVGKLGTLTIIPNPGVWEMPLNFFFESGSKTEDSNIPVLSGNELVDGLNEVQGAYFTLKDEPCDYHGASDYLVTEGGEFEIVKNGSISEEPTAMVPITVKDTTNLIRQYGWYVILVIVLIGLIWVRRMGKSKKWK